MRLIPALGAVALMMLPAIASASVALQVGSTDLGAPKPYSHVRMLLHLPLRNRDALRQLVVSQSSKGLLLFRHWLTPNQFAAYFGPSKSTLAAASLELGRLGFSIVKHTAQSLTIDGTAASYQRAFNADMRLIRDSGGHVGVRYLHRVALSPTLRRLGIEAIDPSPLQAARPTAQTQNRYSPYGSYWFDDLKQAYEYPAFGTPSQGGATGAGISIGILMSSPPKQSDILRYFAHEQLSAPSVSVVNVEGGAKFSPRSSASFEVDLDVEQAGGMAPNASITVYNVPDLYDDSTFAGYDEIIESDAVQLVNSSFGECELLFTAAYNNGQDYTGILRAFDDLFLQGQSEGMTFLASSGDNGSLPCPSLAYFQGQPGATFQPGVEWPADDPAVTAVGGTNLVTTYTRRDKNSEYVSENENGDPLVPYDPYGIGNTVSGGYWGSGGGISAIFPEPSYQTTYTDYQGSGRSVPDIAGHMGGCPAGISQSCNPQDSADIEVFAGHIVGVIGTSASSPDTAGLLALYEQVNGGALGDANQLIYQLGAAQRAGTLGYSLYYENIPGFTGYYYTSYSSTGNPDFDQVLGNGTVIGKDFVFNSGSTPPAGTPGSPSNP